MLAPVTDYILFKKEFDSRFKQTVLDNPKLEILCHQLFKIGTAYVVGGFLRDIALGQESRDMDIIANLPFDDLSDILERLNIIYKVNRLKGIKIKFETVEVDIWSIENNWAFEQNVVSRNDDRILESIGNGCFYNYDALVINIQTHNINIRHFNEMIISNTLDIIQKDKRYKIRNPTIEANILRAFFLHEKFGLLYSKNCQSYLSSRIGYLKDQFGSPKDRLMQVLLKYPKYQGFLSGDTVRYNISRIYDDSNSLL